MVRVWDIQLQRRPFSCDEVWSKCYIFPCDPDQRHTNPLSDEIRSAATEDDRRRRWNAAFEKTDRMAWDVFSLILPGEEIIKSMVNAKEGDSEEEIDDG
jgi:hypothetical protein